MILKLLEIIQVGNAINFIDNEYVKLLCKTYTGIYNKSGFLFGIVT